jgi:hypothetical protein
VNMKDSDTMTMSSGTIGRQSRRPERTSIMTNLIVVFGALDHESRAAIALCRRLGVTTATATVAGKPCHAGNAMAADGFSRDDAREDICHDHFDFVLLECGTKAAPEGRVIARCDHHNPGDAGFGRPPAEYWRASSIGQLYYQFQSRGLIPWPRHEEDEALDVPYPDLLGIPIDLLMVAAGDHCPADAYQGRCPGIDPVSFGALRRGQIAASEGLTVEQVDAAISSATAALIDASDVVCIPGCGIGVRDLRGLGEIPQLPEAALSTGRAYVCEIQERGRDRAPTGNRKIVLGGHTTPKQVIAFREWADTLPGRIGPSYGDPVRGFAGVVLSPVVAA